MRTIYKYYLAPDATMYLPENAQVLHVGEQQGGIQLWVVLDPTAPPIVRRTFLTFGTGHIMPDNPLIHLGTVQMRNGEVYHVFEQPPQ